MCVSGRINYIVQQLLQLLVVTDMVKESSVIEP